MTDLAGALGGTVSCPRCGAQNDLPTGGDGVVRCARCRFEWREGEATAARGDLGSPRGDGDGDDQRGDLEVGELVRSYGVLGYDTAFELVDAPSGAAGGPATGDAAVRCGACGEEVPPGELEVVERRGARSTETAVPAVDVLAVICPRCGTPGVLVLEATA